MFNKKTRRIFRQRKEASSEDEDEQKKNTEEKENPEVALIKKPLHPAQSRGISCNSKREEAPLKPQSIDEDDGETFGGTEETEEKKKANDGIKKKTNTVLSFCDDKEGNDYIGYIYTAQCVNLVFWVSFLVFLFCFR